MRELVFLDEAIADLQDIVRYIAGASGSLAAAERFAARVVAQCERLARLRVQLGRPRPDLRLGMRSFAFRSHVISLPYEPRMLTIVNILHGSRDLPAFFHEGR